MPNQDKTSQNFKPIARLIVALILVLFIAGLDLPCRQVLDFLTAILQRTLVLLPSLALTAWQGLHPMAFEQPHISLCALAHSLLTQLISVT